MQRPYGKAQSEIKKSAAALVPVTLSLPVLVAPYTGVKTLRQEIAESGGEYPLAEKVAEATSYIEKYVGRSYDLYNLAKDELFELRQGLDGYLNMPASRKIEDMINFAHHINDFAWSRISENEKQTIKYTRARDRDSDVNSYKRMNRNREERLASIILQCFPTMREYANAYRIKLVEPPMFTSSDGNMSYIYYVERFLSENVAAKREPIYSDIIYKNICRVLANHNTITSALGTTSLFDLGIDRIPNLLNGMKTFYENRHYLTPKQRTFAFSLMIQYTLLLQQMPNDIKLKVVKQHKTLSAPALAESASQQSRRP